MVHHFYFIFVIQYNVPIYNDIFIFCFVSLQCNIGGCYVEGNVLKNAFQWKQTVGPWENRPGHYGDVWDYWTDDGFGFFEGLQVCIFF